MLENLLIYEIMKPSGISHILSAGLQLLLFF